MTRRLPKEQTPVACFAFTVPGLEAIAAQEIEEALGAEIKKTANGLIVFRVEAVDRALLSLRTVEDVFLLAWGTDRLTYRAEDLKRITRWTLDESDWPRLLQQHHLIRTKPKGRPTYRLVAQMRGEHGYRRVDALQALAKGLGGVFPASWQPAEEGAAVEVWLTIHGRQAVCGVRLSDRSMRHRRYKEAHRPASLRPVVAAAMVRIADVQPDQWLLDPMCGAGTTLAERLLVDGRARVVGGDNDASALYAAVTNLRRRQDEPSLVRWDARRLPLRDRSMPRLLCNPPFGRQLGGAVEIPRLYGQLVREWGRVLAPDARAVVIVENAEAFQKAAWAAGWQQEARYPLRLLGNPCVILAWRVP